jgi:hypothetical protein
MSKRNQTIIFFSKPWIKIFGTPPPMRPATPTFTFPFNAELEAAAKAFKQAFDTRGATYHRAYGQFAAQIAMQEALKAQVNTITDTTLKNELMSLVDGKGWDDLSYKLYHSPIMNDQPYQLSLPDGHVDKKRTTGIVKDKSSINTTLDYQKATDSARKLLANTSLSDADKKMADNILNDQSGTGAWALAFMNNWLNTLPLGPLPFGKVFPFDKVSLPRQCALFINSLVMCGELAIKTARKLYEALPLQPTSLPAFPVTWVTTEGEVDKARSKAAGNMIQTYNPGKLKAAIDKATALLAAGGYLVAGVLSGEKHETNHPYPEHYIMLFAVSGNMFLFWDPDAVTTQIEDLGKKLNPPQDELLGPALGVLFYDTTDPAKPTFSTARNSIDLENLDNNGNHRSYYRRHRYQVVKLEKP